jgi:formamidopyrimidine-DNA glycosylase
MPEIAEVKMITNLIKKYNQSTLTSVCSGQKSKFYDSRFRNTDKLDNDLPCKILDVKTHGKFAYIVLDNGHYIGFGCGLKGHFKNNPTIDRDRELRNCHIQFNVTMLGESTCFYYDDTLKMGNFYYLNQKELDKKLNDLGFDVLIGEINTSKQVVKQFKRFRSNICKVLLNQKCLAGIGNYMKSEILFLCKIDPYLNVVDLSDDQIYDIYKCSRKIASNAYSLISEDSYKSGTFKDSLSVYQKSFCPSGEKVIRISKEDSPDNRATFWVKSIQRPSNKIVLKKKVKIAQKKKIVLKRK